MDYVTVKRPIYPYQHNLSNQQLTLQLFYSLIIRKVKIGVGRNTNGQNLQVQIAQVLQFSSSSDSKSNDWTMKSQLQSIMYQTWSPKRALKGTRLLHQSRATIAPTPPIPISDSITRYRAGIKKNIVAVEYKTLITTGRTVLIIFNIKLFLTAKIRCYGFYRGDHQSSVIQSHLMQVTFGSILAK